MGLLQGFFETAKQMQKKYPVLAKIPLAGKKSSGYAYTNTRVRVMKTKLLGRNDFAKMSKMSFSEIARHLQETEYQREISELATLHEGANLIEYSLNRNMENTFNKIISFSINASQDQIKLYLKRYDVLNVKTFLRGKHAKALDNAILSELICAGGLDRQFFENALKKSATPEQAILQLKGTEYYGIALRFKDDLPKMEDELDRHYYSTVLLDAEPELEAFIRDEIKVKNTLNRLRAEKTELKQDFLENESDIRWNLPKQGDAVENRVFLKKFLLERGNKMVREFKRNIRPVLGYFIAKENEVSNIRILVRGKASGLGPALIEQQLVV